MTFTAKPESIKKAISEVERQISDYHRAQLGSYYGASDDQVARSIDLNTLRDMNLRFGGSRLKEDTEWLDNARARLRTLKRLLEAAR